MTQKIHTFILNLAVLSTVLLLPFFCQAQEAADPPKEMTFRGQKEAKVDHKGRKIETIDTNRMISAETGGLPSAKEYREKLAEDERLRKLAKECGEWFERVQLLDTTTEKTNDFGMVEPGGGMLAYIEAMRIFKVGDDVRKSEGKAARQLKTSLGELLRRRGGEIIVGPGHGVSIADPLELLLLRYQSNKAQTESMDELKPAKSADLWPGSVPRDAQRVTKKIYLNPKVGGWLSTGLYVPPGEVVTIKAPGFSSGSLRAQIGCHADKLDPQVQALDENGKPDKEAPINLAAVKMGWQKITDKRSLWRWPDCIRSFTLKKKKEEVGFALGGMLYFHYSSKNDSLLEVEVSGCVQAPRFRLGIDTDEEWNNTISLYPAPWAEVETKNIVLTVQSDTVRGVTNMTELAQWWGKATAMQYRLAGRKLASDYGTTAPSQAALAAVSGTTNTAVRVTSHMPKPERIVDDTQISIGAGHSGYPIMCIHWGRGMMNLDALRRVGSWGAMHELGHNMGQGSNGVYSLPGNVEVICNVYGCFVMNALNGTPLRQIQTGSWKTVADNIYKPGYGWANAGVFERLVFYLTIADYFGWECFLKAVNDDTKAPGDQPADKMMVLFSKATERDLSPYFEMWGLRLSKNALRYTSKYPPWPTEEEKLKIYTDPYEAAGGPEIRMPSDPCAVKTRRELRQSSGLPPVELN